MQGELIHPYLRPLTFTRFIAASLVVIFHYGKPAMPFRELDWIPELGSMMVSYFFTLSGFILASVYMNVDGKINHWQFWNARIARIVPVYLLSVALVWVINPFYYPDTTSLLLSVSFLQAWVPGYPITGNSPGWSLSVEAFFYLLFPALLFFLIRARLRFAVIFAALLWAASQGAHLGILNFAYDGFPSDSHDFAYYFPLLHLNEFVIGIAAAMFYQQKPQIVASSRMGGVILITCCLALGIIAATHLELSQEMDFNISFTGGLLCPLFLLLILSLCSMHHRFRMLGNQWLVRLGEASYALYLLQTPVDLLCKEWLRPFLVGHRTLSFWIYYLILVAVSLLVYRYFEHPLRKMLRTKMAG